VNLRDDVAIIPNELTQKEEKQRSIDRGILQSLPHVAIGRNFGWLKTRRALGDRTSQKQNKQKIR
jgi:hypothetical protein